MRHPQPPAGHTRRIAVRAVLALAAATLAVAAGAARAEDSATYPDRPVRLVAAQEPGSATDKIARLVADALEREWSRPVVVENRAGAAGTIGAEAVARAAPDGYTLLVGGLSNLAVSPAMRPEVRYDTLRDFAPIGRVAHVPFVFAASTQAPWRTMAEFVASARSNPGKYTYGSLGGGVTGLCNSQLFAATRIDMLAVEYKGASSAITDLVAGRIDFLCNEIGALASQAHAGRVRLVALPGPRRAALVPEVPTAAESGYRDLQVVGWYGLLAPAGTPQPVLDRIARALAAATRSPVFVQRIEAMGYEPVRESAEEFARALRDDVARARRLLADPRAGQPR
ncbi:MAG: tripartite tricarboxylate transporter substrate binding protein [Burkholderiales bacterium]|nr:tripartite tricarboxylate transporter substrate binding protein [Burkholderiales bacterium]